MKTALAALFLSISSVFAAPLEARSSPANPFTLSIIHNHDTELNGQRLNAAQLSLWLGLPGPSTFCPVAPSSCPPGNETAFVGLMSMDVVVPGGQLNYVAPDGTVGYTQAHSASMPPGSYTEGFSWTPLHTNSVLGERGFLDFTAPGQTSGGFYLCNCVPGAPAGATYKLFARVPGFNDADCIEVGKLLTTEYKGGAAAWQYT